MIVLYVLGYFNRNKQNSYAAFNARPRTELPTQRKEEIYRQAVAQKRGIIISLQQKG